MDTLTFLVQCLYQGLRKIHKFLHAHKLQVVPHLLQQVIKVPAVVGWDGHAVGHFVDDIKLLNRDLVYFIEHKNARDVDPVEIRQSDPQCC